MRLTFLGTGTSQGVPVIACDCQVCTSTDPRNKRLRTSALLEAGNLNIVIDTGPDFRYQVLRAELKRLDAVLFTHQHRDHIAGLDDIRSYNFKQKMDMPVYGNQHVVDQIQQEFPYIFESKYPGIPRLQINQIENQPFDIHGLNIMPILVYHHRLPVFGFRIHDLTYITDANSIPEKEMEKIAGTDTLIINALQKEDHISHFTLAGALKVIEEVKPRRAFLTHISHNLGLHAEVSQELPKEVFLAYDTLFDRYMRCITTTTS